ncbi:MAG: glutaredoxin family protein [Acidimicrobiales bacterium]
MNATRLYCQGGCATCVALSRALVEQGVDFDVHDVTTDPTAYEAMVPLGYSSLPVLVAPDGTSAVGADTGELARELGSTNHAPAALIRDLAKGAIAPSSLEVLGTERRRARHLAPSRTDRVPQTGRTGHDA